MPVGDQMRKIGRRVGITTLGLAVVIPLALLVAWVWGTARNTAYPPPAVRHADATAVTSYDVVATSEANLDRLVVSKVFIGPVIDRPQDLIVSPDATFQDKNSTSRPESMWLVYGDFPDDCFVTVHQVSGGEALRVISELSNAQRAAVTRGEKLVLSMKFACGQG